MERRSVRIRTGILAALALVGCGSSTGSTGGTDAGAEATVQGKVAAPVPCTTVVSEANCDKNQRPFVFVHGTYGSGDNFAHVAELLGSNGFCQDRIVGVEYNSLGDQPGNVCTAANMPTGCGNIDAVVNKVLADPKNVDAMGHPFTQVDLAGHSQGTGHCGTYLGVAAQAAKVAHYFNFSGIPSVGAVQTLSLSSMHDLGGTPHHATGNSICTSQVGETSAPAGCNVIQHTFMNQDHFAVAASTDSFVQVYKYLTGKDPQYTTVQCGDDPVTIEGLGETFADNTPIVGRLIAREMTDAPRGATNPVTVMPDSKGHFTTQLKRGIAYEFEGHDNKDALVGYQYFQPFKRSNHLFRALAPASATDGSLAGGTIASQSTDKATRSTQSVTVVVRWYGGGFRKDLGASLKVDGAEVLGDDTAGTIALTGGGNLGGGTVGLFLEDKNGNKKSDLGLVDSAAFIAFTDVYMDAVTPDFHTLELTAGSEDPSIAGVQVKLSDYASKGALINVTFE